MPMETKSQYGWQEVGEYWRVRASQTQSTEYGHAHLRYIMVKT